VNEIFILDILITLVAIGYTVYLVYARYNPELAERNYHKHKANPQAYGIYRKLYSPQFLIIAIITALSFALSLAISIVASVNGSIPSYVSIIEFVVRMVSGLVVLYLVYVLFWKKR
jgi:hypothetical protein